MLNLGQSELINASQIIAVVDLSTAISARRAKDYAAGLLKNAKRISCAGAPKSAVIIHTEEGDKVIFLSISAAAVKSRVAYGRKIEGISLRET
jgi:hypothetical protein